MTIMSERYVLRYSLIDPSRVGTDDPDDDNDDFAIANIRESNPLACIFSLAKALVVHGTIRRCPGHLDLSLCQRNFSRFELFRIACSLIYLKTLTFFSRRPHGKYYTIERKENCHIKSQHKSSLLI